MQRETHNFFSSTGSIVLVIAVDGTRKAEVNSPSGAPWLIAGLRLQSKPELNGGEPQQAELRSAMFNGTVDFLGAKKTVVSARSVLVGMSQEIIQNE